MEPLLLHRWWTRYSLILIVMNWLVQHAGFPGRGKEAQEAFRKAALALP